MRCLGSPLLSQMILQVFFTHRPSSRLSAQKLPPSTVVRGPWGCWLQRLTSVPGTPLSLLLF